jgi:DNA replication protein DnaC
MHADERNGIRPVLTEKETIEYLRRIQEQTKPSRPPEPKREATVELQPTVVSYVASPEHIAEERRRREEWVAEQRRRHEEWVAEQEKQKRDRQIEEARLEREEQKLRLINKLGARYSPERTCLDTFQIYDPRQKPMLAKVRELDLKSMTEEGRGLIFYGSVGTGKDYVLAGLVYRAFELGLSCDWLSGQEFYGGMRDLMGTRSRESAFFETFDSPDILAISDLVPPVGELSEWNTSQLYRLIDRRYRLLKPTWLTLNVADMGEADSVLSAPTLDRLQHGAVVIPFPWKSFRERKAG